MERVSRASAANRLRSRAAISIVVLLGLWASVLTASPSGVQAQTSEFRVAFNGQLHGGVIFAQNTIVTCNGVRDNGSRDEQGCLDARAGTGSLQNNNLWRVAYVDVDEDPTTFNSSSAPLRLPAAGNVVWAALYWGANTTANSGNPSIPLADAGSLLLSTPTGTGYVRVTADPADIKNIRGAYQASAVVTDLVRAGGAGMYTVANLPAALGSNQWGGWTLAVVFEDLARPLRDITLFQGFGEIYRNVASFPLSGFRTPVVGPVDATIGIVAYEGDAGASGDYATFNGVRLTSAESPGNNYFNSRIETFGSPVTGAVPELRNQFGFDVKVADATGILPNSANSATVTVGSTGDQIFLGLVSTRIDLTAPRFPDILAVQNLSGHDDTETGDLLRYKLSLTNIGDDPAAEVIIRNPIPAGTSYVPGSLTVDGVTMTDADGDDVIEVIEIDQVRTVVIRFGTGADAESGGRMAIDASSVVTYDVTVTAAPGSTITNTAHLDYRAVTLDKPVSTPTNTVVTPVLDLPAPPPVLEPELSVQKIAPERVPAGTEVHYDLVVRNTGTAAATEVVLVDQIPDAMTVTEVSQGCEARVAEVTCELGTVEVGETWIGSITVMTDSAIAAETRITNEATVTATGGFEATGQARTTIAGSVDLSIDVDPDLTRPDSSDPDSSGGDLVISVTNNDPHPAQDVEIHVVIPDGIEVVDSGDCVVDEYLSQVSVTCTLGQVPANSAEQVVVPFIVTPAHDGSEGVTAVVTGSALDRNPEGNLATASLSAPDATTLPATGTESTIWLIALAIGLLGIGALIRPRTPGRRVS